VKFLLAFFLTAAFALAGPRGSLDPRTAEFCVRVYNGSGSAPTPLGRAQVGAFVQNSVTISLWSSMVCWPLLSSQNAGTGTVVYSLGGLGVYDGTLVNGPTWGADGVALGNGRMTIGSDILPQTFVYAGNSAGAGANRRIFSRSDASESMLFVDSASGNWYWQNAPGANIAILSNVSSTSRSIVTGVLASDGSDARLYVGSSLIGSDNSYTPIGAGNTFFANGTGQPLGGTAVFLLASADIWNTGTVTAFNSLFAATLGSGLP
jgi:hypothetical protein